MSEALTAEQQSVVDAPMAALSVIACAGSGKTKTAVHRLAAMRRSLGASRGRVALLSFSNVAVDTFRQAYQLLANEFPDGVGRERVEISTLDGFITSAILRAHAHRTMGAKRAPYLVTGDESFLAGFTFKGKSFPIGVAKLQVVIEGGQERFSYTEFESVVDVDAATASALISRLGKTGAYTHDHGRYWAYRTLKENPKLLKALVRRFPYVLIDEAQDIGSVHQAILQLLIDAGCCVTLIGDPNQGIYEFAGATGAFLRDYGTRAGVISFALQRNFRSVPTIVNLANALCSRSDVAVRAAPGPSSGAYFIGYKSDEHAHLLTAFQGAAALVGADIGRSAVLCRARALAVQIRGHNPTAGQGAVKWFAEAAVLRDRKKDLAKAFRLVATAISSLLEEPDPGLVSSITPASNVGHAKELRREIWAFTRAPSTGLPSASLDADTAWHPLLLKRVKGLLDRLDAGFGLKPVEKIGPRLKKTALPSGPLLAARDLADDDQVTLRVDTVHQAKGESLDAVLYVTERRHVDALLAGVDSELGRIGYVAATRARDLLWVAVPANALAELRPLLLAKGFQEAGAGSAVPVGPTGRSMGA